ncbi:hypothetical protein FXO38_06446 [Capsicum annuum]|nr:hypothetical protein FXO38_06446 [Capsicum annuum]KAF3678263.1 hypothetical protein FXO37_04463 [Capsicum annuum]
MERDARGTVCQIVRYEKVQGPIITVMESDETLYFWDAFSNFLPLMDKLKNEGDSVESSSKWPPFASCETEHETHLPVRESSWSMLRRKFVSGNMKDFVFSSKSGISGVYPDSMFITIDNFANHYTLPVCCLHRLHAHNLHLQYRYLQHNLYLLNQQPHHLLNSLVTPPRLIQASIQNVFPILQLCYL